MSKFLKLFNSHLEYQLYVASNDFIAPNVSRCINLDEVHYTPEPYYGFCKLTLDTGEIIEIEGSGSISSSHLSQYSSEIVEIQLGLLCTGMSRTVTNDCSKLTSIIIGKNVNTVSNSSLSNSSHSIESIIVENGNSKYDSRNNCNAVIETATNKLIVGCKNTTIPDTITTIGQSALNNKGITSVVIPSSVISIGSKAFNNCSELANIVVNSNNTIYDSRDNCNAIIETATNTLIFGCKNTIIPNSIVSINENAFLECSSLTSIVIPNNVINIGNEAFRGCSGLTSINIGSGVSNLGDGIFKECTNLTSIIIPENITSISSLMFYGCGNLDSITLPNTLTSIGGGAFSGCINLTSVTIPNSVTNIGNSAFYYCSSLTSITIPNSVTSIGGHAFSGCRLLTYIIVENNNSVYDSRNNCNAIIETATNTLIQGCRGTTIPNSVTSIGLSAFSGMKLLVNIEIPNSVTSIGLSAFNDCSYLTSIIIGSGVTSIGQSAFTVCNKLTSITSLAMTAPSIQSNTFYNMTSDGVLYVPQGSSGYDVWINLLNSYNSNWTKIEQ